MMHTSMLAREELRIFEELISCFDSLTEAQMSVVGVTSEWSAKDLLAHLAYWERAAAEQVRAFEAGKWSAKKRTRAQMARINREVVSANRATPRHLLREELILARSEIVGAMKRAPEELEEGLRSLKSFTLSACGTGAIIWNNLKVGLYVLAYHGEREGIERVSVQFDSADAGPRSHNKSSNNVLLDALGGCFSFITRFPNTDLSSSPFKGNFVHSQFH